MEKLMIWQTMLVDALEFLHTGREESGYIIIDSVIKDLQDSQANKITSSENTHLQLTNALDEVRRRGDIIEELLTQNHQLEKYKRMYEDLCK